MVLGAGSFEGAVVVEDKIVRAVLKDCQRKLGSRLSISVMGDGAFKSEPTEFFSTGVSLLDRALGGGFPVGRLSEIFGDVATGKTLMLLTAIARAQRQGAICFYLDTERATSRDFAKRLCGVNDETLVHLEPKTQEDLWQAVFTIITAVREQDEEHPILIGVDSLAGVGARAEKEASFDEEIAMAKAARIIRSAMRRLTTEFSDNRVAVVFTNQEIMRIGVPAFAEQTMSWGGTGPKYHSSVRLKLRQTGWEKVNGEKVGANIKATVVKNRMDPAGREIEYTIWNQGEFPGIDDVGSVVDFLNYRGELGNKKGWTQWDGETLRRDALVTKARNSDSLFTDLKTRAFQVFSLLARRDAEEVDGES